MDHDAPDDLRAALHGRNAVVLKQILALLEKPAVTRKAELVDRLHAILLSDRLAAVLGSLTTMEHAAVSEAVHSWGGRWRPNAFEAKHGELPDWGEASEYSRRAPSRLHLFFHGAAGIPSDLRQRLAPLVQAPEGCEMRCIPEPPAQIEARVPSWSKRAGTTLPVATVATEDRALSELPAMLQLVMGGRLTVSAQGRRPTPSTVRAAVALLHGGDFYPEDPDARAEEKIGPIRAFAWPMLLQAGGLARVRDARLELTPAGRATASDGAAAHALRELWQRWLATDLFDELSRVEAIRGQTGRGARGLTECAGRRQGIARLLARCPVDRWVEFEELIRFAAAERIDLQVTSAPWCLYLSSSDYGRLGDGGGDEAIASRYLLCFLLEYASTLGLIDVAITTPECARNDFRALWGTDGMAFLSRYDGLHAVRLNPLGAFCLGLSSSYQRAAPTAARFRVLATREVVATTAAVDPADRLVLGEFASAESDRTWRLETDRILAALDRGRSVEELRRFLGAGSAAELPQTVAVLLADIERRRDQVRDDGPARLIECADASVALLIASDRRAGGLCLRAGERHLVVRSSTEKAFRSAVRALGYVVGGEGRKASPVTPSTAMPSPVTPGTVMQHGVPTSTMDVMEQGDEPPTGSGAPAVGTRA